MKNKILALSFLAVFSASISLGWFINAIRHKNRDQLIQEFIEIDQEYYYLAGKSLINAGVLLNTYSHNCQCGLLKEDTERALELNKRVRELTERRNELLKKYKTND